MSPEFRSLLMKEWAERRSLFRFAIVYIVVFLGYGIAYEFEYRTRTLVASFFQTSVMFGSLAAVLLAMSTATGEYTRRTLKFSASLPVSLRTVAWARLLGAWGCLVIPIICGAVLITLLLASGLVEQAGLRSETVRLPDRPSLSRLAAIHFLWTTTAIAVAITLQLFTLLSLLGTRCRNEGTVGFVGAIVVLFSFMLTTIRPTLDSMGQYLLSDWIGGVVPQSLAINWGYGELDGSTYTDLELAPLIAGPLFVSLLLTLVLATWFTRCYGHRMNASAQPAKPRRRWLPRVAMPAVISRFRFRWPGRMAALTWLNARQSVPLCLAGLTIAVMIAMMQLFEEGSRKTLAGELPSTTWFVGTLWAAIVAVGVFSSELKPGLEHFLRSRPIAPGTWFWTKFAVGLIAVVGTLDVIPLLLAWSSPYEPSTHPQDRISYLSYLACMPLIHAFVYAIAVAAICRLRRAIPAAMIALLLFFILDSMLKSIPGQSNFSTIDVYNKLDQVEKAGERINLLNEGYPVVYGIVIAVILGATLFARRTLIPPRIARKIVLPAMLIGLRLMNGAITIHAAETPTAADIVAGMKQREALVRDVRMRFQTRQHRTEAFHANWTAGLTDMQKRRLRGDAPVRQPSDEEKTYELFERLPCNAWKEFGPNGAVQSIVAFDGATNCQFTIGSPRSSFRMSSAQSYGAPFLRPETALMSCGGTALTHLLSTFDQPSGEILHSSLSQRELDGERLIDIAFTRTISESMAVGVDGREHNATSYEHRYQVTVNATRHYWPIRVQLEIAEANGRLISRIETKAEGWIDAGPLVYPRRVEQLTYQPVPVPGDKVTSEAQPQQADQPSASPKLELLITHEVELLEIAVNTDLPDAVFAPAFPVGSVIYDQKLRKHFEVIADGTEQVYQPKPKGLQGAVFVYHLLWIASAVASLFIRKGTV